MFAFDDGPDDTLANLELITILSPEAMRQIELLRLRQKLGLLDR